MFHLEQQGSDGKRILSLHKAINVHHRVSKKVPNQT